MESIRKIVLAMLLPVVDYGNIIYMHAAESVLKPLDSVYYSALCFITRADFRTHRCILYSLVSWESLTIRRATFVYKAVLQRLLSSCINW